MATTYKRCINCGNYFELNENEKDREFCNDSCVTHYERCQTCGNYFITNGDTSEPFTCSDGCKEVINIKQKRK